MWWDKEDGKKLPPGGEVPPRPVWKPPPAAPVENPVKEQTTKVVTPMPINATNSTVLGRSVVLHGELTGNEDLLVEGQFDGSIHVQEHCLTVGAGGQVKAEIHARQVIVHGKVTGNITALEKVEIRKTGHVLGDLTTAGIAIEDGAYFKRAWQPPVPRPLRAVGETVPVSDSLAPSRVSLWKKSAGSFEIVLTIIRPLRRGWSVPNHKGKGGRCNRLPAAWERSNPFQANPFPDSRVPPWNGFGIILRMSVGLRSSSVGRCTGRQLISCFDATSNYTWAMPSRRC